MSTNPNKNQKHIFFMNLALHQAMINLGNTKENPSVGCVIVRNGSLIAVGSTSLNGRPHAEHNAIINSKGKLNDSELYVTLEPCSNYGKTNPCVLNIIKNKFKKVYFSIKDPDVRSFNKASKVLRKNKIAVNIGISSNKIKKFYKSYIQSKKSKIPFVTCKLASSRDYYTINKSGKWITNEFSRGRVHIMRSQHDSIITSSKTVNIDNPVLNCRIKGLEKKSPSRIILDNYLKILTNSKVVKDSSKYRTIIFYNKKNVKKITQLKKKGIKTYRIPLNAKGDLDLREVLIKAKKLGFYRIFLESGIELASNFLKEGLVNDLKIFISNNKLKRNGTGNIKKYFKTLLKEKKYIVEKVNLMDEKLISYKIR